MARPLKLTKFSVQNALAQSGSVTAAAVYSGVNRRSFQRAMQRFGIAFAAAPDRFKALLEPAEVKLEQVAEPEPAASPTPMPVEPKPRPERNILRLSANDFSGTYIAGAGRPSFAGADGLIARYHRLRGK